MTKELVTIEFRYHDKPESEHFSGYKTKTITIGIFDTFEEAIIEGNEALKVFENHFSIHTFPDGRKANKDRFGKNNGPFGVATRLVSPLAYLKTPFDFYAKITKLTHSDVGQAISEVLEAEKRYKEHKLTQNESD